MEQLQTFLAMGGYGAFVWPAFGVTALVMVGLLAASLRRLLALQRAFGEHDETYMPPEVADALKKAGQWKGGGGGKE